MATIVQTPARESDNGMGFLLGVLLLIIFGVLFIYYLGPALSTGLRGIGGGGTTITVPKDINVNLNQK